MLYNGNKSLVSSWVISLRPNNMKSNANEFLQALLTLVMPMDSCHEYEL